MKSFLFAAVLSSALALVPGTEEPLAAKVGAPAPDFAGKWINHPDSSLVGLGGRIVFIESWRTW